MEGLPGDALRVFHPIHVRPRIAASRASLVQGRDVGTSHLLAQAAQFLIGVHMKAEVIYTGNRTPL